VAGLWLAALRAIAAEHRRARFDVLHAFWVDEPGWVALSAPDGGAGLSFQTETAYVRPTWPAGPGDQQMMSHLDIEVDDLAAAGTHAVAAGAVLADYQPQEHVRVYLDPAGHPFCLWVRP